MLAVRKWVKSEDGKSFKVQEENSFIDLDDAKKFCIFHRFKRMVPETPKSSPHLEIYELEKNQNEGSTLCYFVQE